jgi:transposase InsO family protein
VRGIRQAYQLSENRACGLVRITRWINRYQSRRDPQDQLRQRLRELAGNRPRYGYRRLTVMLRREGWKVNTKRVYRIYREENMSVRTTKRKKRSGHLRVPLPEPIRPNQRWSMDFVSDRLAPMGALVPDSHGGGSVHARVLVRPRRSLADRRESCCANEAAGGSAWCARIDHHR